jgi:hypothetical protein
MKTATKLRLGLILFGLTTSALAGAQPSPSGGRPAPKPEKAEKAATKAEAKADKADSKAEKSDAKSDPAARPGVGPDGLRGGPRMGPHDHGMEPHGGGGMGAHAHAHGGGHHVGGMGHGVGPHGRMGGRFGAGYRGAVHQLLHEEFKGGTIDKKQLEAGIAKLREQRDERRKEHRESMKRRWGGMLAQAPVRTELTHHARRIAFLNRALFVAQTDAKVKDRDKLVTRIEKLLEKEHERHDRAMARLKSAPPSGSAHAGAATPASSASGTAEKTGDPR